MAGLALLGGTVVGGIWLWQSTPDVHAIASRAQARPSRIVSSDGVLLDRIGANQSQPVTLDQVSPAIVQALLATEDRRFHEHGAVDVRRMIAAIGNTLRGNVQGASTLTQQLARNLFPKQIGNDRSVLRKLREIVVAIKIERAYSKEQILTLYLNQVPYLYDVVGVEMAARTYFSKSASEIEPHEAALLVAMLKGPNYFDPERRPQRARDRRNLVLSLMARHGYLDEASHRDAKARPLGVKLTRHDTAVPIAPHYLRAVRNQVAEWAEPRGIDPQRDGLTIQVGLDSRLQKLAEQAVERQGELLQSVAANEWSRAQLRSGPPAKGTSSKGFEHFWRTNEALRVEVARQSDAYRKARDAGADDAAALRAAERDGEFQQLLAAKTRLEAGLVALDPRTGQVRAWVGSRDWRHDRFDHVAQARRQPGSTFKPFVYGAALVAGIPQNQMYIDGPVTLTTADGQLWTPGDVGGSSGQPMMMRTGLARSRNTITAQVMQQVGPHEVANFARSMGIDQSKLDPVLSLALGTSPVTLLEMAGAYGTLAALGIRRDPLLVDRIDDREGRVLAQFSSTPKRVLDPDTAAVMVDILREAVDSGTGTALRTQFNLQGDIAGKTGTTQRNSDGWFLSLQPGLVVGAWVGFNDQRVTMRSNRWGQGGSSALLLVGDLLREGAKRQLIDMQEQFPITERPAPPMRWSHEPAVSEESAWDSAAAHQPEAAEPEVPVRSAQFRFDTPERPRPLIPAPDSPTGAVRHAVQVIEPEATAPGSAAPVAVAPRTVPPPPIERGSASTALPTAVPVAVPVPAPVPPAAARQVSEPPVEPPLVERVGRPVPERIERTEPLPRPLPERIEGPSPRPAAVPAPVRIAPPPSAQPEPPVTTDYRSSPISGQPIGTSAMPLQGQPVGRQIGSAAPQRIERQPSYRPAEPVAVPPSGEPVGRPYVPGSLPIQVQARREIGPGGGGVLHIDAAPVEMVR